MPAHHVEYAESTFNMLSLLTRKCNLTFLGHLYLKLHVSFFLDRIFSPWIHVVEAGAVVIWVILQSVINLWTLY